PPKEAEGQANAAPHRSRQRAQIGSALGGRARLRSAERADESVRPYCRHRPGQNQNRPRQPRLQHAANDLALRPGRRLTRPIRRNPLPPIIGRRAQLRITSAGPLRREKEPFLEVSKCLMWIWHISMSLKRTVQTRV